MESFRQSGSFAAGLLIGLSIVVATFAVTAADSSAWRNFLILGAPVILVLGFALLALVAAKPRRRHVATTEREIFPWGLAAVFDAR